jgi:hypothetical protein
MSDSVKPYSRMSDVEKKKYSKFIQTKYIADFAEYLEIINKGRITLHKRQLIDWVEGLRTFGPEVLKAGWKGWIQKLKPHYMPSIADAIEHFKRTSATMATTEHKKITEEPVSVDDKSDFGRLMHICMKYGTIGPIAFHKRCIEFYKSMVSKEKDRDNALSFNDAIHEHTRQLKEAEASPLIRQVSKENQEKVVNRIEELFVEGKELKGDESPI